VAATTPAEPRRPDRRRARHEATKKTIADAAWTMIRADGLNGLSLRALARSVEMEPQSLYTYFASKHAVYDQLFGDANHELLGRLNAIDTTTTTDPDATLRAIARVFVTFNAEDQARYELLFMRTIPDFEPSPGSYEVASQVFAKGRSLLDTAGLVNDADFDLWTAIVAGLTSQQLANDPGGDRYIQLIDAAVTMFSGYMRHRYRDRGASP
jgi:AcrR family transcriptional regulator